MEIAHLVGRILFGGFFAMMGLNHFMQVGMMKPYAAAKGVPAPGFAVLFSGLLLLAGGLSIATGWEPAWGVAALTLFLLPVSLTMHNFWAVPEEQKMNEMTNFMKNMALLGASWTLLAFPAPWPYAL